MKKEKSPVLVIFCIFLLSLFVILPPTFRSIIPKEEVNTNQELEIKKIMIVNCNMIYPDELYQVNSRTRYTDGIPPINNLTFTKLDALPEGYTPSATPPTTKAVDELTYLKAIPNIQVVENENIVTIAINNSIVSATPTDTKLAQYLASDSETQKTTLESLGYTCNIIEG